MKFQATNHLLLLYRLVCVGPGRNPNCWFSHAQAHIVFLIIISLSIFKKKKYYLILYFKFEGCPAGANVEIKFAINL